IKKVTEDIENFKFNTAVSTLMIFINETSQFQISKKDFKIFLQILAPFAPHITEELWHSLGEKKSIHLSPWPTYDSGKVIDEKITIGVQINGKLRAELLIDKEDTEETIEKGALSLPKIQEYVSGKEIQKVVVVPGRIVNIVIRG
ncbi:MAG: class I tRNA ligase family protein, partial [Patescibacteria group bacterium]